MRLHPTELLHPSQPDLPQKNTRSIYLKRVRTRCHLPHDYGSVPLPSLQRFFSFFFFFLVRYLGFRFFILDVWVFRAPTHMQRLSKVVRVGASCCVMICASLLRLRPRMWIFVWCSSLAVTVNHVHAERKRGIPSAFAGNRYTKQW